jgi:hypothetical protein
MPKLRTCLVLLALSLLGACSTTQETVLAKAAPARKVASVAQAPEVDNSPEMNGHLEAALRKQGLALKPALPAGSRKTADADAVISYVDVWRWDLVMYLKSLSVRLYDAETGDLLVSGQWSDSALHGFRDARQVMDTVVSDMFARLKAATP